MSLCAAALRPALVRPRCRKGSNIVQRSIPKTHIHYAVELALNHIEAALKVGLIDWQVAETLLQDFAGDSLLTPELQAKAWALHDQVRDSLDDMYPKRRGCAV